MAKKSSQTAEMHQSRPSQSGIPVFTPRKSQSAVPSTISTPQLGLVPPTRHLSVSGSPQHPSPSSSSSSTTGGITPFRSFRNLFSTASGSSKNPNPTPPVSSPKPSFPATALGSLRRSIGGDRSVSAPSFRPNQELLYDDTPVLQIDLPRPDFESFVLGAVSSQDGYSSAAGPSQPALFPSPTASHLKTPSAGFSEHRQSIQLDRSPPRSRRNALPTKDMRLPRPATEPSFARSANLGAPVQSTSSTSSLQAQHSGGFTPSPSPSPAVNPTDLSTIIEAENSGLSKHLPPLDSSQEGDTSPSSDDDAADPEQDTLDPKLLHALSRNKLAPTPPSKDSSVLDLSTSKVTSEVLQAMGGAGPDRTQGWLNGVVVEDNDPEPERDLLTESGNTGDGDASFNLSELDPDLAALLSPNRLVGSSAEPTRHSAADGLPAPSSPRRPAAATSPSESPRRPAFSRTPPGSSPPRQSEPLRMPKSRAAPNLPSAMASHSRPNRSVSDRPVIQRLHSDSPPLGVPNTARGLSHSPERPSTATEGRQREPLDHYASRRPHTGTGESPISVPRRSAISRLLSPARLGPYVTSPSSFSHPSSRTSPRLPQDAPPSPASSRPSSAAGLASTRLKPAARSSLDVRPSLDEGSHTSATPYRHRKRSLSVVEAGQSALAGREYPRPQSSRTATEWLGPQTAKAFAAAGLLDQSYARERDSASVGRRTPSRFGTTRSSIDDSRSRYVPSRMAFSEAGSAGSWPRGETPSVSRRGSIVRTPTLTATVSELGGPETPRTTFSAASTAPTSVSASSSAHVHSELQSLQERHQVETGALLSALADSQRTAKVLREENTQLRDRLADVEFKLAEAMEEIQGMQYAPPHSAPVGSRASHSRYESAAAGRLSRVGSRSPHKQSSLRDFESPEASHPSPVSEANRTALPANRPELQPYLDTRKRMSTSSSLFPGPPSNMSMLMHEDSFSAAGSARGDRDHSLDLSSRPQSPASPTLVVAKLSCGPIKGREEKMRPEPGNISPTTADFSMVTSSPGSLNLRPEHELHLDDMPSFELNPELEDGAYDADLL